MISYFDFRDTCSTQSNICDGVFYNNFFTRKALIAINYFYEKDWLGLKYASLNQLITRTRCLFPWRLITLKNQALTMVSTYFLPLGTSENHKILMFSGGIERRRGWHEMSYLENLFLYKRFSVSNTYVYSIQ